MLWFCEEVRGLWGLTLGLGDRESPRTMSWVFSLVEGGLGLWGLGKALGQCTNTPSSSFGLRVEKASVCSALLDLGTAEADSPPNTSQEEGFGNLHSPHSYAAVLLLKALDVEEI